MGRGRLQALLRNAGILLSGNVVGAGLAFIASMLAARTLGPSALGQIALIQSVIYAVDRLVNFQSWRTLIRYGADALEEGSPESFRQVTSFSVLLDVSSALLGALISAIAVWALSSHYGWSRELTTLGYVYSAGVAANLIGTPIGLLRLFDQFGLLAQHRVVSGVAKLTGVTGAALLSPHPETILAVWIGMDLFSWGYLMWLAWRAYRARGYAWPSLRSVAGIRTRHEGIVSFALVTNITLSIRAGAKELDQMLVGTLLSAHALGLYRVAKSFGGIVGQLQDPLMHAVYPELARRFAARDSAGFAATLRATARFTFFAGPAVFAGFYFGADLLLLLSAGPEFLEARETLIVYAGVLCFLFMFFYVNSAMLALGKANWPLVASIAGTLVFFVTIGPLTGRLGVVGAAWAQAALYGVWMTIMLAALAREWRLWRERLEAEHA